MAGRLQARIEKLENQIEPTEHPLDYSPAIIAKLIPQVKDDPAYWLPKIITELEHYGVKP